MTRRTAKPSSAAAAPPSSIPVATPKPAPAASGGGATLYQQTRAEVDRIGQEIRQLLDAAQQQRLTQATDDLLARINSISDLVNHTWAMLNEAEKARLTKAVEDATDRAAYLDGMKTHLAEIRAQMAQDAANRAKGFENIKAEVERIKDKTAALLKANGWSH